MVYWWREMGEQLEMKILGKQLEMDIMEKFPVKDVYKYHRVCKEWNTLLSFNKSDVAKCDYQQSFIVGVVRYISQ
jgi:hypothetical protein